MGPESKIEEFLVRRVRGLGGIAYKFTSPSRRSVPDRMVLMPGGEITFVELKAPGKVSTKLQAREQRKIQEMGFRVLVIDSREGVKKAFPEMGISGKDCPCMELDNLDQLIGDFPKGTGE